VFRRGRWAALLLLSLVVGATGTACKGKSHLEAFVPTPTTAKARVLGQTVSALAGIPAPTRLALAARATGPAVAVYTAPGPGGVSKTLSNPTIEGMPLAFFAVDQQGDWLQVRLPERPNGVTGWIKADQVALTPLDNRIVINVGERRLRVLDKAQQVIFETNVAVGKDRTPTPLGRFYVDISLPKPGSPYGAYLLSISGFSEVLKSFKGGRGQIAMHGWSDASVMGTAASNGCLRMRNADISHLATLAPLGTPVEILA
jgi:lipoprotein-anchoring transpeptidase ErfK/SrfK